MASRAELLVEANRRGLLKGEQKTAFDEAVRRGLIEVNAPSVAAPAEPAIDYHQQMIDEMPWYEKGAVGVGRGFMDTAQGVKQIGLGIGEHFGWVDEGTTDAYTAEKTKELEHYNKLADDSPWLAGGGRLIGGVASAPVPGAGVGATLARRALTSGAVNAGVGATQFVEEGGSRATNAALGGALGWAGQGALEKGSEFGKRAIGNTIEALRARVGSDAMNRLSADQQQYFAQQALESGIPADEITEGLLRRWADQASEAVGTPMRNALPTEREFDFPLTRGQRSGKDDLLGEEDALRNGRRGQPAREKMLAGQSIQEARALAIADDLKRQYAGGGNILENRADAGAALRESVRAAAATKKAEMNAAYDAALNSNPGLLASDMRALTKNARAALDEGADPQLPQTARTLNNLKQLNKTLKAAGKSDESVLYSLKDIDMQRKRLNTAIDATENKADRRQVIQIKKAFDDSIDDAVSRGLFQGDAEAIQKLKGARGMAADYYSKFRGKEDGGRFIKKLIEENPTDAEVINSLFTTSSFSKGAAQNLAKRYKEILGTESEAWSQVKQAALDSIIKRTTSTAGDRSIAAVSGTQTLKALRNAEAANKGLLLEIFSKDEISQVRRFAVLVQQSQPVSKNPSGTANTLVEEALKTTTGGGAAEAVLAGTGNFGALAAKKAGEFVAGYWKNKSATNAAEKAFRPFERAINAPEYVPWKKMALDKDVFGQRVYLPVNQGAAADDYSEELR